MFAGVDDPGLEDALCRLSLAKRVGFILAETSHRGRSVRWQFSQGEMLRANAEPQVVAIGCIIEFLTAVLALQLDAAGILAIEEPVVAVLPELGAWAAQGAPKIRHLLTRSSGVQDPRSPLELVRGLAWTKLAQELCRSPQLFSPGVAFSYAGPDTATLAQAIERRLHRTVSDLTAEWILSPLAIEPKLLATVIGEHHSEAGATIDDLAKFASALANRSLPGLETDWGASQDRIDLSAGLPAPPIRHAPMRFCEGAFLFADGLLGFNGKARGQSCALRFDPNTGFSASVALDGPQPICEAAIELIADAAGYGDEREFKSSRAVGRIIDADQLELVGRYTGWARDHSALVSCDGRQVQVTRLFREQRVRTTSLLIAGDELFAQGDDASSLGFFRDPKTRRLGLTCGTLPYARTSAA